ncbi:prepilin peptidase [Candidatus Wolfebacteria bacterium]|nr:prepilin peptidase [Candidatus Wolfebacteria bacterium]
MYFFLFVFGLAIGSFLNVVSMRFKPKQEIFDFKSLNLLCGGRSRCPHCHKILKWYELAPIFSFLFQKGKCLSCGHKLSFQYLIVEILTGLIFVFVPLSLVKFFPYILYSKFYILIAILWLLIFTLFLLLSIIDFRHYIIPDLINLSLAILGIILIFFESQDYSIFNSFIGHYALLFGSFGNIWVDHFFAAFISMALYGIIIILSRGKGMGWGDFKLIAAIGLIFGWPDTLIIALLAFIIGSLFVIPLLIRGKKKMKDAVPFGPFIIIAAAVVFFFGFQMTDAYFKFFNLFVK